MIAALIWDVDGTLAETEETHRAAFNAAFAAAGLDWVWGQALYARLLTVTGGKERIAHYIAAHGGRPPLTAAAIAALHADKTRRYAEAVAAGCLPLRPGVVRLLNEARDAGVPVAIATTTTLGNVEALLRTALGPNAMARFAAIGAGDDVAAKKPSPEIYDMVVQRLGVPPARCVAIEDSANGVRAAQDAGVPVVVTQSLYGGTGGFEGALAVLDHLGDPGTPCTVVAGPPVIAGMVALADLTRWLAG